MSQNFVTVDGDGFVVAFYSDAITPIEDLPNDAIEITHEAKSMLVAGRSAGKRMRVLSDGEPQLIDPSPPTDAEARVRLLVMIDNAADLARLAVAGDPLRAAEYQVAEAEAKAWQAGGYVGEAPPSVRSWAEAKNWTGQAAAENILAEAAAWNAALYALRDARLKAKEAVRNAADLDTATAIATQAIEAIRVRVENLGNASA